MKKTIEQIEAERMNRRKALGRIGFLAGASAVAALTSDDLTRLVGQEMQKRAGDVEVVKAIARELQASGIAFATGIRACDTEEDQGSCLSCCVRHQGWCLDSCGPQPFGCDTFPAPWCTAWNNCVDACTNGAQACSTTCAQIEPHPLICGYDSNAGCAGYCPRDAPICTFGPGTDECGCATSDGTVFYNPRTHTYTYYGTN